ncbi:HipA domain-containing protein [Shewanella sp. BF02_Schw]|uniref:HipA domain-containing protein n=1 Tax=Shewanella sp. BF02_Schw TaxID=394908 RepID=UPI00177B2E74|nr:HipA domain-containing protein [Shewanella sp. BF02_Schw]MBO1897634.1 HipA domain-containing protein [Shewanella sp. BF02_Schw]
MLSVYFVGINIDKFSAKRKCDKGDILRYQSGIYFDNELKNSKSDVELSRNIKTLHSSVKFYAPWIVSYINPNSTLVASSAYFKSASEDNTIFIDGVTNGRKSIIGSKILDDYPHHDVDLSIKVERLRLPDQLLGDEVETSTLSDDNLNELVDVAGGSVDKIALRESLESFTIKFTNFDRTFSDIVRWDNSDPRSLNDLDLIAYLSENDVDITTPEGSQKFKAHLENIYTRCSSKQILQIKDRLNGIMALMNEPSVNAALKRMNFKEASKNSKQTYDVYHFNDKKFKLYNIDGTRWAASGDNWIIPLENGTIGTGLPKAISGMLPEIHKIDNNNFEAFFNKASRFMSNIQVVDIKKHIGYFDYHTHYLNDSQVFNGKVIDVPDLSDKFAFNIAALSMQEGLPKISGVQMKLPMNLDLVDDRFVLSVALNKPFTHILKVPGIDQQNFVMGEWFGLKAVEHAGVTSVAKNQIAEIMQGDITTYGLISERFDISSEKSVKLRAIDLLSIMDMGPKDKYGKSSEIVMQCVNHLNHNKITAKTDVYTLMAASVICANTDLHLKNMSLIKDERFGPLTENSTANIAPIYDVVVSTVMPGYEHEKQALSINGTFKPQMVDLIEFGQKVLNITKEESIKRLEKICWEMFKFTKNCQQLYPDVAAIKPLNHALNVCGETVLNNIVKYAPSLSTGEWLDVGVEYKEISHTDLIGYKKLPSLVNDAKLKESQKQELTDKPVPYEFQPF